MQETLCRVGISRSRYVDVLPAPPFRSSCQPTARSASDRTDDMKLTRRTAGQGGLADVPATEDAPSPRRGHSPIADTADIGIEAYGSDLTELFEEAAAAYADLTADVGDAVAGADAGRMQEHVTLGAHDLPSLAFAWLNELVALGDLRRAAVTGGRVHRVDVASTGPGARLDGTVWLAAFDDVRVRRRAAVKSATYYRLAVRHDGDRWRMTAHLDV